MITEAILNGFQGIVTFILGLLPNIPNMNSTIQSAMDGVVSIINNTVGVVAYIYTPVVFVFIMALIFAILGFDFIYKFVLWILHKVRG